MKSLSIHGKRWFQRGPGNTYFSAYALIDGAPAGAIEYAYGYGSQYEDSMFSKLDKEGKLPAPVEHYQNGGHESAWRYCERLGIAYSTSVADVRRKKDL